MRLLLDTHVVLWQLSGERTLSTPAQTAIRSAQAIFVSAVAFAEIGLKSAVGKLNVPDNLLDQALRSGLRILPLSPEHGLGVADLPMHHRDPFDRLLVSQARAEGLTIVTADRRIPRYDVAYIHAD